MLEISQNFRLGPITASMVVSASGSHLDPDGTSKLLGGAADLELLKTFRNRADWVLTTGLTARAESYRLPKTASLAVLTRSGKAGLPNSLRPEQVRIIGSDEEVEAGTAIALLTKSRESTIHIEFGPATLVPLIQQDPRIELYVSSEFETGPENFALRHNLQLGRQVWIDGLFISSITGRA